MKADTVVGDTSGKSIEEIVTIASKLQEELSRLTNQLTFIEMVAEVTTVVPLTPDLTVSLQKKLSRLTGKNVLLKTFIDESILGGMVIRMGDKVLDFSIRSRLDKLREKFVSDKGLGSDDGNS
ncbi:F0F1 ATP synthase subunit delta [Candidatus Oleimmundimicrobium sp.]|uniref:F0F1 ATP synthase subunit delta n=1 Tax=Candidatus Oleimmundimicrobium sp. TaxID=3060597 RepID=UPI00271B3AC7|nr:F0F1 ATP synthase subunit delta [Candidatus Oleimmundimicrobium sp.]MDO8885471.1 F0F1 ATP synthase subunit delta [Candidatus Oleimmundimicrobium sp.]